jgi:hypothetical protein
MKTKQELLIDVLSNELKTCKVGLLVRCISDVSPLEVMRSLTEQYQKRLYAVAVGYDCPLADDAQLFLTHRIEDAVRWRSDPELAGCIIAFVRSESDKLHSLKELDVVTNRSVSEQLITDRIKEENQNTPTKNFWNAIRNILDRFTFESLLEFAAIVDTETDKTTAIPKNMWRLGLLCDETILGAKSSAEQLTSNCDLIIEMGQISETSRKHLTSALGKVKDDDRQRYETAYRDLQAFFKYGKKETLKTMSYTTIRELLKAAKAPKKQTPTGGDISTGISAIREKELQKIIAQYVVCKEESGVEFLSDIYTDVCKHFSENDGSTSDVQTTYDDRQIQLDRHNTPLRKLVNRVETADCWGGIMITDEFVLRDAISSPPVSIDEFRPEDIHSMTATDNSSLFDCFRRFDEQFRQRHDENVDFFVPIIEKLIANRNVLLANLDIIMYFPVLGFGVNEALLDALQKYTEVWAELLRTFCRNEPTMHEISSDLTEVVARRLLFLEVLYIKTETEWKAMLLPLHPIYLWRFNEVFKSLITQTELSETDSKSLIEVMTQLPQILNFVVVDGSITGENKIELPCSGTCEMLPTFENKTNRYLGYDGIECVEQILSRWVAFAPYTKKEIRICTVDAPDHATVLKILRDFLDANPDSHVVYSVYLTRGQNGNTEIAKLDYDSKDYEVRDLIRSGRLSLNIRNVSGLDAIKQELNEKPVHVAFYFDQSSYKIEHGPSTQQLYVNPLVVTYDYSYDQMRKRGVIFPSSDMKSGIIGDYFRVMNHANVFSSRNTPRPTYNPEVTINDLLTTVADKETIWLTAIDRSISNYTPKDTIPIGEKRTGHRTYGIWASDNSRIVDQYLGLLRNYNLFPQKQTVLDILSEFGHISADGLISIPRSGADGTAIENRKKGLIGTIFAAKWFSKTYPNSIVASLDSDEAKLWLRDVQFEKEKHERADLIGLYFEEATETLHVIPIEVKTRDEQPDATVKVASPINEISGHAADQIASVINMLHEIFERQTENMFVSARREVLKYQIVSECFREVHDDAWQLDWEKKLRKLFSNDPQQEININISGMLIHVKLSEVEKGKTEHCVHQQDADCLIDLVELTSKDIQSFVLESIPVQTIPIDFDETAPISPSEIEIDHDRPVEDASVQTDDEPVIKPVADTLLTESVAVLHDTVLAPNTTVLPLPVSQPEEGVSQKEIEQLARDFNRSCQERRISIDKCDPAHAIVGASIIRFTFKLGRGQSINALRNQLDDISREMRCTGVLVQDIPNSDESYLDVPRLKREKVLFSDVIGKIMPTTSPEQLYFALGRTPGGEDVFKNLADCPHLLVGGSTGSGKTVFLFTLLTSLLLSHTSPKDMQLVLSSSGLEDFIHFEGLPHLIGGKILSDATETMHTIQEVVFTEFERRKKLLAGARVENIIRYNETHEEKLAPMVVVVDEFADLTDQLSNKREKEAFYTPIRQIAQIGRKRGIHLVLCTQRPSADLLPTNIKSQVNGRVALRVNDATASRMILDEVGAQELQKNGDMIYKNVSEVQRAQGYLITVNEVATIVERLKAFRF